MPRNGFTLLEMLISIAILSVVSLLGFIAIRSSYESQTLIEAQGEVQADLRNAMAAIHADLELAYAEPEVDSVNNPEGVNPVFVAPDGKSITFFRPTPDDSPQGFQWTGPITLRHLNEDLDDGHGGNARLDSGEDRNGDGLLNRQLIREVGGNETPVGGANNLAAVQFELIRNANPKDVRDTRLRIHLVATKRYGPGLQKSIRQELESEIQFLN